MPRLREWRAAHIEKQNHMCQKTADSEAKASHGSGIEAGGGRHQSSDNLTRNFQRPPASPFIFRPLLYTRGKRAICLKIHVQAVDINLRTRGFLKLKFVRDFMSTTSGRFDWLPELAIPGRGHADFSLEGFAKGHF